MRVAKNRVPRAPPLKDGTINSVASVGQRGPETAAASVRPTYNSAARVDIALLVSALFLQRFTLPFFGGKSTSLCMVPIAVIFVHQFASGRLLIQYDRLLWYILLALAATSSLLLNFSKSSLSSYSLFLIIYFLFTLHHPSNTYQYKETLKGFQVLMLILSCLAILQFPAQFIVDPRALLMFFGIFPDVLLPYHAGVNTMGIIGPAGLIKSNGIFLTEASTMSQIVAIALLIEVLEFRRPRYLVVLTLGLLLAYSGTGISILLISFPVAFLVNRRAQLPVLMVSIIAIGLLATGIIHSSTFTGRLGEFQDTGASGFMRFVSPFWMAADYFHTGSLWEFLFGNGLGGIGFVPLGFYTKSGDTWFNLVYEYGLLAAFVFTCFLGFCFRRSWCPTPVIVGLVYNYLFTGNVLLDPAYLTIVVVLCTLNGPTVPRGQMDEAGRSRLPVVAGAATNIQTKSANKASIGKAISALYL
jgi:hypothetical protein